jgi:hypothetical protein
MTTLIGLQIGAKLVEVSMVLNTILDGIDTGLLAQFLGTDDLPILRRAKLESLEQSSNRPPLVGLEFSVIGIKMMNGNHSHLANPFSTAQIVS